MNLAMVLQWSFAHISCTQEKENHTRICQLLCLNVLVITAEPQVTSLSMI